MRVIRVIAAIAVLAFIVVSACDCGTNGDDDNNGNGNGNGDPTGIGDYLLSGNIGDLFYTDGSFQLEVSRLDTSLTTGANEVTVTLNGDSVPMLTGSVEDAIFVKNNIGFEPDKDYTVVVTLGSLSSTCNLTVSETWGLEVTSPTDGSSWTPGDPVTVTWNYTGGTPDSIEIMADDEVDSEEWDYYAVVHGSSNSHTIPGSATESLEGALWIDVCPLTDVWWFTGDLHATGSFVVQVYACDAITLNESGSTSPGSIYLYAAPMEIPADGSSSSTLTATVTDSFGMAVPNGTRVDFSTSLGSIDPPYSTTTDGVAMTTLTSSTSPGTAIVVASSEGIADTVNVEFEEVVDVEISVGSGEFPSISWTPSSEQAYALNVGAIGVIIPKWNIVSAVGFSTPVTYGTVPSGATQTVPMAGSPDGLVNGTEYRISLVTAGDDTTFYTFVR